MELTGSEKQVKWAEQIRERAQAKFAQLRIEHEQMIARSLAAGKTTPERCEEARRVRETAIRLANEQSAARFWIDHRDYSGKMLMQTMLAEAQRIEGVA